MARFYKFSDIMRVVYSRYNLPGDLGTEKTKRMDERVRRVVRSRLNQVEYRNARTESGYPEDVIIKLLGEELKDELIELSEEANKLAEPQIKQINENLKKEGLFMKYSENVDEFEKQLRDVLRANVAGISGGGNAFFFAEIMAALHNGKKVCVLIEEPLSGPGVKDVVCDAELFDEQLSIFFESGESATLRLSAKEITMKTAQKFYVNCKDAGQVATVWFVGD